MVGCGEARVILYLFEDGLVYRVLSCGAWFKGYEQEECEDCSDGVGCYFFHIGIKFLFIMFIMFYFMCQIYYLFILSDEHCHVDWHIDYFVCLLYISRSQHYSAAYSLAEELSYYIEGLVALVVVTRFYLHYGYLSVFRQEEVELILAFVVIVVQVVSVAYEFAGYEVLC